MIYSWIMDSGGAGRGAWQGGVLYEFMRWSRENRRFPTITMGASAGGYAAADVATGTERTVMKGWTVWGKPEQLLYADKRTYGRHRHRNNFRKHLSASIFYVMEETEQDGVFNGDAERKLLVFTTRVRRKDGKPFKGFDRLRYCMKTATRKFPRGLKYFPGSYVEEPVIFATNLPPELQSEYVRTLTREKYHAVIEASCLVPIAMGYPLLPEELSDSLYETDRRSVFFDGSYTLKMPMGIFEEDARFLDLAQWAGAEKTIVFCCDPEGRLWENSMRLRSLNGVPNVQRDIEENRLLIIYPDHKVEAGFLCTDNAVIMRTFNRGREQGQRLLQAEKVRDFFNEK